jgi:hypothetical protein
MKLVRNLALLALPVALLACSADKSPAPKTSTSKTSPTSKAKPKENVTPKSLGKFGGSTAPEGAKDEGKKSSPHVASTTVPITDVEVYTFSFDWNGDGTDDAMSWAYANGHTYLWAEGPITCDDDSSDGTGGFVAEINEDGSGSYLFSVDACPTNDDYGCDFDTDGNDTTCGACSWNEDVIACVAAE